MKKSDREALDAYYAEAGSWSEDQLKNLRTSRRTAWLVAGAACAVALCEAIALIVLTPLKTVEPYTLLVDRQTGFVQQLKPLDPQMISGDRALTQSFLVQYVIAREGFDINSLQNDYRKVALWSAGQARTNYLSAMQASSPESPLSRLPRSSLVDVQVKSVTAMGDDSAMVRFDTQRRDSGGRSHAPQSWVTIIRYTYSGEPLSLEDRMINPLGFKVSDYRKSAETLTAPQSDVETVEVPASHPATAAPQGPAQP